MHTENTKPVVGGGGDCGSSGVAASPEHSRVIVAPSGSLRSPLSHSIDSVPNKKVKMMKFVAVAGGKEKEKREEKK